MPPPRSTRPAAAAPPPRRCYGSPARCRSPRSPRRIARIVAGAMTEILDVPATAVMLWDDEAPRSTSRVVSRAGRSRPPRSSTRSSSRPPSFRNLAALLEADGARIVPARRRRRPNPIVAELAAAGLPDRWRVAPIRAHDGEFSGLAIAAITDAHHHRADTVIERLVAIGDQAATAVQNAQLLEQIRHQAVHDNLTGLANRALFDEELDKTLARARRRRHTGQRAVRRPRRLQVDQRPLRPRRRRPRPAHRRPAPRGGRPSG